MSDSSATRPDGLTPAQWWAWEQRRRRAAPAPPPPTGELPLTPPTALLPGARRRQQLIRSLYSLPYSV